VFLEQIHANPLDHTLPTIAPAVASAARQQQKMAIVPVGSEVDEAVRMAEKIVRSGAAGAGGDEAIRQ
jgi:hypothetical protein